VPRIFINGQEIEIPEGVEIVVIGDLSDEPYDDDSEFYDSDGFDEDPPDFL